jgi:hypothetical protein
VIHLALIEEAYEAIDNLNQLLSIPAFITSITQLLSHSEEKIRRRALVLFNEKIANERESLSDEEAELFINMAGSLVKLLERPDSNKEVRSLLAIYVLISKGGDQQTVCFTQH